MMGTEQEHLSEEQGEELMSEVSVITEPFDPGKIRITMWQPTVDLLMQRVRENEIDLEPDFQRRAGLWKPWEKSRLIESLLIKIPLPSFYLDSTDENQLFVVDGLQRLSTLRDFIVEEKMKLEGLEFLIDLNGKSFKDLPRYLIRRILETQLTAFLIEKGTPDEVKYNIFKRINTGGLPLSQQEIRHALNRGPARDMIATLASSKEFIDATANGVSQERMQDRALVLRFMAFVLNPPDSYSSRSFDVFLNESFKTLNSIEQEKRDDLSRRMLRSLVASKQIFDDDAFRKRISENDKRHPVNYTLFESWTYNLDRCTDEMLAKLIANSARVRACYRKRLIEDGEFLAAISSGTDDKRKIITRFETVRQIILDALTEAPGDQ
ncbi:MAG: DUF262 domain-containing protein [Myxococcota bacterium]|nr:DUF262 domain-containing protein [Myxococcota bacterium]